MRVQPSGSKVPQPGVLQQTGSVRTLTAEGWSFPVPEGQPVTFENLPGYWLQMAELACVAYDVFGSIEWQQHRVAYAQCAPIKSRTTSLDWHGRKIHRGFRRAWQSIRGQVVRRSCAISP